MGLQVRIILYSETEKLAVEAATAAFEEVARLDEMMSDYRVDSELTLLSESSGTGPVRVSSDLFTVLEASNLLSKRTEGAFDVTIGPVVDLWRTARRTARLPDSADLDAARQRVGHEHLILDAVDSTATLAVSGMRLDLGGIAKGYAADRALAAARHAGVTRFLIEIGGDVRVGDPPPGREGWTIEVAHAEEAHRFVELSNAAMAASGDTEQFVEIDGIRYSHVVDPRTGLGLTSRIAVTIIAPDGLTADGVATAVSVLGPEDGAALLQTYYPDLRAVWGLGSGLDL